MQPKHTIYNPTTKCSCINLLLNTKNQNQKNKSKISFPSPTLKTNIVLNVKNEEIKGLKTSLMSEASLLLILETVSLA